MPPRCRSLVLFLCLTTARTITTTCLFRQRMAIKYLITGATGGLGKHVLRYFVENVPLSEFAAASSKSSNKSMFEDRGIAFRHINYDDSKSLDTGLHGVENLLFISSVGSARIEQHSRLIDAAKKAGVKHVWYTSLAFGGFGNNSRSPIQAEHVLTEKLLKEYVVDRLPKHR
ncbi:NmrA family protein [Colletotrichum truncatum]|uniref:NmrA family protein n=1 Tax=Colletotrichum truncatum TaxID=5467 RepID=A0ACC3YVN3_COLTU